MYVNMCELAGRQPLASFETLTRQVAMKMEGSINTYATRYARNRLEDITGRNESRKGLDGMVDPQCLRGS